jgi:hypothetical protein
MSHLLSQPLVTAELESLIVFSDDRQLEPTPARLTVITTFNKTQRFGVIRVFLPPGDLSSEVSDFEVTQYKEDADVDYLVSESYRILQSLFEQLKRKLEGMSHG